MKRIIQLSIFSLLISQISFSQTAPKSPVSFQKIIAARFAKQWLNAPQEKVYMQTDKPYYNAGESIWFKAYLLNATTHRANTLSRYVYVELIDKSDSVVIRQKIKKDSLGFSGCIKLKPEISAGNYTLSAYTYWMQNVSEDFFFHKNIYIGNNIDTRVNCSVTYSKPANGKIAVHLAFTNNSKNPIPDKAVITNQSWVYSNKRILNATTGTDGKVHLQLPYDGSEHKKRSIDVAINEKFTKYKNRFLLPEFSNDYDVQFFPESGVLLNSQLQVVAFKAISVDGLSVEVSGTIYNNKNEEITEFSSKNKGMGKIAFEANPGETYYAVVKSADGLEKRFNLPQTQAEGVTMHLTYNRGKISYDINNSTRHPNDSLFLLVHCRGIAYVATPLTYLQGQINESILPSGVVSLSVVDSIGNTYCERLFFVRNNTTQPQINMIPDKATYGRRQPVDLAFSFMSSAGNPLKGNFSLSVTDSKVVKTDSLADNIMSYLLLGSDLKGYIEDPGSYFVDNSNSTREKLDMLMMTQGWRRFNTADVVKAKYKQPVYYLEAGQTLSGKVINVLNQPVKNCDVMMLSGYKNMISSTKTDSTGRYLIDGIEFPDSTSIILKAKKKIKYPDVEIVPDADIFPVATSYIPVLHEQNKDQIDEYFRQSREKYYKEGGMMFVNLDEVTIKAMNKQDNLNTHYYSGMEDYKLTAEKIAENAGLTIMDLISMIPGVQVNGEQVSIRGSQNNPLFLIDEIEVTDMTEVTYLNSDDVEDIEVFKGANTAMFGSKGGNGVIAISLKKGMIHKAVTPPSLTYVTPLGFQKATEFYVPKYDVDSIRKADKADLRTTIYWNPEVGTDINGVAHVKFFTADKANNYAVTLEGVSKDGEICRFTGIIQRKDE